MNEKQVQSLLNPRRKAGRGWKTAAVLLLAVFAWAAYPHVKAGSLPRPSGTPADAILVLTGGENRIAEGYRAWRDGKGSVLLIIGAGRDATLDLILPGKPVLSADELRRIHVEGWSKNTLENAVSAKALVTGRGYRSVILVTSDYHLARAHLALRWALPEEVTIAVLPVRSEWKGGSAWWRVPRLFLVEGLKYWGHRLFLLWE